LFTNAPTQQSDDQLQMMMMMMMIINRASLLEKAHGL